MRLGHAEKKRLSHDLANILDWVNQLRNVDTSDVAPIISMSPHINNLAPDLPEAPLSAREALANAPAHDGAYFHVPKKKS